eukprot:m.166276 g.166276  ORF g.166276 m.166276 type:complete len:410 (-) comp16436_c16_seq2:755-1984(-)
MRFPAMVNYDATSCQILAWRVAFQLAIKAFQHFAWCLEPPPLPPQQQPQPPQQMSYQPYAAYSTTTVVNTVPSSMNEAQPYPDVGPVTGPQTNMTYTTTTSTVATDGKSADTTSPAYLSSPSPSSVSSLSASTSQTGSGHMGAGLDLSQLFSPRHQSTLDEVFETKQAVAAKALLAHSSTQSNNSVTGTTTYDTSLSERNPFAPSVSMPVDDKANTVMGLSAPTTTTAYFAPTASSLPPSTTTTTTHQVQSMSSGAYHPDSAINSAVEYSQAPAPTLYTYATQSTYNDGSVSYQQDQQQYPSSVQTAAVASSQYTDPATAYYNQMYTTPDQLNTGDYGTYYQQQTYQAQTPTADYHGQVYQQQQYVYNNQPVPAKNPFASILDSDDPNTPADGVLRPTKAPLARRTLMD